MKSLLARFIAEQEGQDLIEYALLTAFIGLAGAVGFELLGSAIGNAYSKWDTNVNGLWEPPPPS